MGDLRVDWEVLLTVIPATIVMVGIVLLLVHLVDSLVRTLLLSLKYLYIVKRLSSEERSLAMLTLYWRLFCEEVKLVLVVWRVLGHKLPKDIEDELDQLKHM